MTRSQAAAYYGGLIVLTGLLLALVVPFGEWPLRVPFDYKGDGVIHAALVKGVAEEGPLRLTRIGAPFGADIVDWPMGMWLPLAVTSGLVRITDHAGSAMNLYWLLSIVLTCVSATWTLRRLGVRPAPGFAFGLLYSFIPYVFYRNTSHFGTMFPLVPLVALLALRLAGTAPERLDRREIWITLGACFAQGLSYIYYAFFACILLAAGALLAWLRSRDRRLPRLAAIGILLLALGATIPLVPSFAYWHRHGRNDRLAYKTVAEADHYGLKLRHLVTPIDGHPIGLLRDLADRTAEAKFPLENENTTAKLGLIGSLGFLALLAFALARAAGAAGADSELGPAATLTLTSLLVAQVGGFGSIFSLFVSPDIRGYNRIVVFIAFFAFYAGAILLSRGLDRLPSHAGRAWTGAAILAALCLFGVADQVPRAFLASVRADTAPQFSEDESFVALLESRLPAGAMVFQLPHAAIPLDLTSRPPMMPYDPGRAYVSSRTLRWSWGSVLGRTGDWQAQTSRLSPAAMTRRLSLAGFVGIWVDRRGYPEPGPAGWSGLESALAEAAGASILASSAGRYSFVELGDLRRRMEATMGRDGFESARAAALDNFVLSPRWREGCSDEQGDVRTPSRFCGATAWAVLKNDDVRERPVVLRAELRAIRNGRLHLRVGEFQDEIDLTDRWVPYRRELTVPGDRRLRIDLAFDGACETPRDETARCVEIRDLRAAAGAAGLGRLP